jgi:hypothetical protein
VTPPTVNVLFVTEGSLSLLRLIVFRAWRKRGAHLFLCRAQMFVSMA